MTELVKIEGIGEKFAWKLKGAGVRTVEDLLEAGASPKGRQDLAEKAGVNPDLILEWVNHADLFRIKGVGEEYSDLLEEAGVDTVVELSKRNAENLHAKLVEVGAKKNLVNRPPSLSAVQDWIEQAKKMDRVITY